MLKTKPLRSLVALGFLSIAALGVPQEFAPKAGEFLILRIRTFHAKDWKMARAEMIKAVDAAHTADPTEQDVIVGEDPSTHRMLALAWADRANFKPRVVHQTVPHLNRIMAAPKIEREFRIFAANDEPLKPRLGDAIVLYWPNVKKGSESTIERMVKTRMMPMLKRDRHNRDSFAMRDLKNGKFLAVAFSRWEERNQRLIGAMDAELKPHHYAPVKSEVFRVVLCHFE